MTTPTAPELLLLRTQPQQTKLFLSIFEPQTIYTARVNDAGAAKGDRVITYDTGVGTRTDVTGGMTMYVGTTAGGKEKGSIWLRKAPSATEITVGENSHINWANNDYLTIVNFYQIWPVYPRYIQGGTEVTVYKYYDIGHTDENEDLGSFVVMGSHYAGFMLDGTGTVYWDASESENVIGMTGTSYSWIFEGGTPATSTAETPGWIGYTGTGHYKTLLTTTEPAGSNDDYGVRQVSIYDRPGEGDNTPILNWGLESLAGSRDEGGYTARIWVKEDVSSVVDGALVVLFADDWYGTTEQSIGGNSTNRESIVFVGYIIDGSIDYDYQTSTVFFDVGSPSEIMKLGEAFSVSVEDCVTPATSVSQKGGDEWFYLVGLSTKTALYHYYRWHSTVASLLDIRYEGSEFDIQYFDADRTSLYDAANTFLKTTAYGRAVCDRQGTLYFEIEAGATDNAAASLTSNMLIGNHDWYGNPEITEEFVEDVSYLEMGGVAYSGGGTGTYSALLAGGPGLVPAYRGRNMKLSGLALTSQGQLNTLVGNVWENMNANYPEVSLDLVGNFRNIDIAPQEVITLDVVTGDTYRGINWSEKAFTPRAMSWKYNAENNLFLPSLTLKEITDGDDGETIAIPVTPPEGGFDQPPIVVPPPLPPVPWPPLDWGFGGYEFVHAHGDEETSGVEGSHYLDSYGYRLGNGDDDQGAAMHVTNIEYTGASITIYPVIHIVSSSAGNLIYVLTVNSHEMSGVSYNNETTTDKNTPWSSYAIGSGKGDYLIDGLPLVNSESGGFGLEMYFRRHGEDASDTVDDSVWLLGFIIAYG